MNIKAVLLTFITTFISLACYPQVAYIATDTTLSSGLNLIEGIRSNNAFYIRVNRRGETIKYTPDQLQGYGLKDGTVFTSKEVSLPDGENKELFLQDLSQGPISTSLSSSLASRSRFSDSSIISSEYISVSSF
jgi:hypothetical protein